MTRRQAYKRLGLVAFVLWVAVSIAGGGPVIGAVMAVAVFATGALAAELGLGRRRRVEDEQRDE